MKIGDLAKATGLSNHTLRYYEKMGLLAASGRSEGNYRIYTSDDKDTANFIKRCKNNGFSLDETKTLLQIKHNKAQHVCAEAKSLTQHKITELSEQIIQMQRMVETLKKLESYCCGGQASAEFCTIVSALEGEPQLKSQHEECC